MAITQNGKPVVGNVRDTEALFLLRWRLPDGKYEVERAPGYDCSYPRVAEKGTPSASAVWIVGLLPRP